MEANANDRFQEYYNNTADDYRTALIIEAFLDGMDEDELLSLLNRKGYCGLYPKLLSDILWKYIFQNHLSFEEAVILFSKFKRRLKKI